MGPASCTNAQSGDTVSLAREWPFPFANEMDMIEMLHNTNEEVPMPTLPAEDSTPTGVNGSACPSSVTAGLVRDRAIPGVLRRPLGAHYATIRTTRIPTDIGAAARATANSPTSTTAPTTSTTAAPATVATRAAILHQGELSWPAPKPADQLSWLPPADLRTPDDVAFAAPLETAPGAPFRAHRSRLREELRVREGRATAQVALQPAALPRTPVSDGETQAEVDKSDGRSDLLRAGRNAGFLGVSLIAQYGLAFAALVVLPHLVTDQQYGRVTAALRFCELLFVVLALGTETYVRRVVSVNPRHAAEFLPGLLVFRIASGAVLLSVGLLAQQLTGRGARLQLIALFGLAQICIHTNTTTAAVLHAVGDVRVLSRVNSAAKFLWLVLVLGGLWGGMGLTAVPLGLFASELVKSIATNRLVHRHLDISFRVRPEVTLRVIRNSLPFLLLSLGPVLTTTLDVTLMDFLTRSDREIGWYGLATQIALLALGLAPVISWTLQPVLARAATRSTMEFEAIARAALHHVLAVVVPMGVVMSVNAGTITRLFPAKYAPAARSLTLLSLMFIVTYVAQLIGMFLVQLEQGWFVARVTFTGVILNALANLVAIPYGFHHWGAGGAGIAAAATFLTAETLITITTLGRYGMRRAFDGQTLRALFKTIAIAGWIALFHHLVFRRLGILAPVVEAVLSMVLLALFQVIDTRALVRFVRNARSKGTTTTVGGAA